MNTVAVIGLGYVGLPLVVEFGKHMDISKPKVASCQRGVDPSRELEDEQLKAAKHAVYTDDPALLAEADMIIVAVPTPVDEAHIPDFKPLIGSSTSVGRHMKKGATIIYESTVYPGATEEVCIPVLEKESGLKWKQDFFVGYSPERINPGDKEHTLTKILKIVSGDTPETLDKVARLYEKIIIPGVHRASSIKAAEAAKVIENTQRDLNIALMNELAIIFDKIGIDTTEVLEAAGTKWNFLKFKPGLVGGHCIGVDPYYLTHKADMLGYHPQVILAGRRINDSMGKFIAEQTIKHMIAAGSYIKGAKVNVLGLTFKAQQQGHRHHQRTQDLRRRGLRHRPAGRERRGHARVRRAAAPLGRPAPRRCHRGRRGAPRVRGAVGRRPGQEDGQERRLHRRQGRLRPTGPGRCGLQGVETLRQTVLHCPRSAAGLRDER